MPGSLEPLAQCEYRAISTSVQDAKSAAEIVDWITRLQLPYQMCRCRQNTFISILSIRKYAVFAPL